jgi:hypothetical protein
MSVAPKMLIKDNWQPVDTAISVLNIGALFGAASVAVLAAAKRALAYVHIPAPRVIRYAATVTYLLYCAPNYPSAWVNSSSWNTIMNDVVTIISILKTVADNSDTLNDGGTWATSWEKISPFAESVINAAWLAPAIGSALGASKPSDWISYESNVCFDLGGIITFLTVDEVTGPELALAFFAAAEVMTLAYGVLCVAYAGTYIAGS